jgi:hypothetical protein
VFYTHWEFWVQLLISAGILTSAYLSGSVKISGWIVLMFVQTIFIGYVFATRQWGLIPQNLGMGFIAFRNYRKWKREGIGYRRKPSAGEDVLA